MDKGSVEEKLATWLNGLHEVLVAKNKNYGNSALIPASLVPTLTVKQAILVRLSDKIKRLQTLAAGEQDKVGESFDDTLQDMAGYIALYFIAD